MFDDDFDQEFFSELDRLVEERVSWARETDIFS